MDLNPITNAIVRSALDAALIRHSTISTNIANANTPGFTPMKVTFEEQLATEKAALIERTDSPSDLNRLLDLRPVVEPIDANVSGKVLIDMEMVKLAKNTVQYQALLKAVGKNTAILSMAIKEGR